MFLFCKKRRKNKNENEPILVAVIENTVSSEIFQNILKENEIPFICKQQGAGGYIKIAMGSLFATDTIYVNPENAEKAKELYEAYLETEIISEE